MTVCDFPSAMESAETSEIAHLTGEWSVAQVLSHHEGRLRLDLRMRGIGCYVPMLWVRRVVAGQIKAKLLPAFPGYVFACYASEADYSIMRGHESVYGIIQVKDQVRLVRELTAVELATQSKLNLTLYPGLIIGRSCQIIAGPMLGAKGILISRGNGREFVLQVSMLGQAIAVETDPENIELIDDDS